MPCVPPRSPQPFPFCLPPARPAGMPVVLNQLLSDRRPAAQALLRELLLNADGTLRSDATTQQIMQVWLAAADQAAAAAAGDSVGAAAPAGGRGGSGLVASLSMGPAEAAGGPPGDGGLDLAALLLDGRNAPLRRIAMDANPAKTISSMPPAMRLQLKEVRGWAGRLPVVNMPPCDEHTTNPVAFTPLTSKAICADAIIVNTRAARLLALLCSSMADPTLD